MNFIRLMRSSQSTCWIYICDSFNNYSKAFCKTQRQTSLSCLQSLAATCIVSSNIYSKIKRRENEWLMSISVYRSNPSEVVLVEGVLKIYRKFTGQHPCRRAISIKLRSSFIEIALRHCCSPINLLHIYRTPFLKATSE